MAVKKRPEYLKECITENPIEFFIIDLLLPQSKNGTTVIRWAIFADVSYTTEKGKLATKKEVLCEFESHLPIFRPSCEEIIDFIEDEITLPPKAHRIKLLELLKFKVWEV